MFTTLIPGDVFGIITPAYIPNSERLEKGISYLISKGFKIKTGRNINKTRGYFAGTDEERLEDFHDMFHDPEVKIICAARGGWGGLRLVDKIDYDLIKSNPKPLIGYSDITTLQLAIWHRAHVFSFSGPMVAVEMGKGIDVFTEGHFWNQLLNKEKSYRINLLETQTIAFKKGKTSGKLLGGCLSLVTSLLGTPYCPDFSDAILFLEDVGEKPYKIDRFFAQLKQAGVFAKISGLILGEFLECSAEPGEISLTFEEIIQDYFSDVPYPVLINFPYGHSDKKITIPIGVKARLDTEKLQLVFDNPFMI